MAATKPQKAAAPKRPAKDQAREQAHGPEKKQRDVTATPSKASDRHYKDHQGGH